LQELYVNHQEKGFVILGFPCNQFGFQEPASNKDIKKFATTKFGVSFQLFAKIKVNGFSAHPIYKFLRSNTPSKGLFGSLIKWNFTKFLVDKSGKPVRRYAPGVKPLDIEPDILRLINDEPLAEPSE